MRKSLPVTVIIFLTILISNSSFSQRISFMSKAETGYLNFLGHIVTVDPGPAWKGYYLNENTGAFSISSINGLSFLNRRLFTGAGVGYMNFNSIHGATIFGEVESVLFRSGFSPFISVRVGYSHIWNQYENGTGTPMVNPGVGVNYKISDKLGLYFKTGILFTQQSALLPLLIGIRF